MKLPLKFHTYSQLRSDGWKMEKIMNLDPDLDLLIAADRDEARRILGYTWSLTRKGKPIESGEAMTRAGCVHAAYKLCFLEKRAI